MKNSNNRYKRKLILGIDPGTTCGLAVIDLNARPFILISKKAISMDEIIHEVTRLGKPILVASDVSPMPEFVKKVASKLNASIFTPKVSMRGNKKREVVQRYLSNQKIRLKDIHEIDALAAALKAHNHYKNKFDQIDALKSNSQIDLDEIKSCVVKGMQIKEALKSHEKNKKMKKMGKSVLRNPRVDKSSHKRIIELCLIIKKLKMEKITLHEEVKRLKSEISMLKELSRKKSEEFEFEVKKDRIIQLQKREIETLSMQLRKLKLAKRTKKAENIDTVNKLVAEGKMIFLKPVRKFTFENVNYAINEFKIKEGDIPILLDASGGGSSTAQSLIRAGIKAIIACTPMSHQAEDKFVEHNVPVLNCKQVRIEWIDKNPYAGTEEINKAIREVEAKLLWKRHELNMESFLLKLNNS